MDTHIPDLGPALLRWVNTFDLDAELTTFKDIQDGRVLWKILGTVDSEYFSGELPEPSARSSDNWIPKWQNLKHINRLVWSFIRDECGKLQEISKTIDYDLKAVATDAAPEGSLQLLKAVLLAALYSPQSNSRMVMVMNELGPKVAQPFVTCITAIESLEQKLEDAAAKEDVDSDVDRLSSADRNASSSPPASSWRKDPDLEREERLIEAYARINKLEDRNAELVGQLQRWTTDATRLRQDLTAANDRLTKGIRTEADTKTIEDLREKSKEDRDYIAELEVQVSELTNNSTTLQQQVDKLSEDSESKQRLRDELQLLRVEREELVQKAKATDNLRKKIQSLQDADKGGQTTREALESELRDLRPVKDRLARLQKSYEENQIALQNVEQQMFDQQLTRKRHDRDLQDARKQIQDLKEEKQKLQDLNKELEEKSHVAADGDVATPRGLDEEFSGSDKTYSDLKAENSRLHEEIATLSQNVALPADDDDTKQTAYESLQLRCQKLERQYLETYQENLGLESVIKSAGNDISQSQPFIEMRERLGGEATKRAEAEQQLVELEKAYSDGVAQLKSVQWQLSAIGKDKTAALSELTESAAAQTEVLREENNRLLEHLKSLRLESDTNSSLLRHSLLEVDSLMREAPALRSSNEYKWIVECLKQVINDSSQEEPMALRLTKRIEDSLSAANKHESSITEQLEPLKSQIQALQVELSDARVAASKTPKLAPDDANLRRELSLITSAWYDLTRRMQSDAVVVQRRNEAPRSFLNRQRRLLNNPVPPVRPSMPTV